MACNVTAKSGQSKGLEDALGSSVKGKLQGRYKRQHVFHHWFRVLSRLLLANLNISTLFLLNFRG